jgi:hypothetical protein
MKPMRRLERAALIAFCVLASVLLLGYVAFAPNPKLAENEQYAALSAYVESGLTGDSHDLGSRHETVVIFNTPTFSSQLVKNTRLRQYLLLVTGTAHPKAVIPRLRPTLLFDLYMANVRNVAFTSRFRISAPYELATERDIQTYGSGQFAVRFPSAYGYLTFSRLAFNRNLTEAFFYTEHICGLCGEGKWVFMRKVDGKWIVENTASTWIS